MCDHMIMSIFAGRIKDRILLCVCFVCVCVCVCAYTCVRVNVSVSAWMRACIRVHVRVHVCIRLHQDVQNIWMKIRLMEQFLFCTTKNRYLQRNQPSKDALHIVQL